MNEFRARRFKMRLTEASLKAVFFIAVIVGLYCLGLGVHQLWVGGAEPRFSDYSSCFLRINYPPYDDGEGGYGPWGRRPQ
jgi:hypothetical protein